MTAMNADTGASVVERAKNFDLHDPALQHDPYPTYAAMRSACPVAHAETHGGHYVLTRYADIRAVALDAETFSNKQVLIPDWEFPLGEQIPVSTDGDDHRKYRLVLADLFSPAAVDRIEPRLRARAVELAEQFATAGGGDFVTSFAVPMANETFLAIFDVGPEVLPNLLAFKDLLVHGGASGREQLKQDEIGLVGFFRELLQRRRDEGATGGDVLSALARSQRAGEPIADEAILNMAIVLMLASLDTTAASMSNAFVWLTDHPDGRQRLIDEPGLVPYAVEELLRFEGVTGTVRTVLRPTEVGGVALEPGDKLMLLMGAANRDPEEFAHPDEVDLDRKAVRHLTFGVGPHRCLGMHLARRTIRVGIEEFHRRVPDYTVAPGTRPRRVLGHVRGVAGLELAVTART